LTASGPRRFRICGIYRDFGSDRGAILMSRAHYREAWGDDSITSLGLYLAAGSDPSSVIAELRAEPEPASAIMRSNSESALSRYSSAFAITRPLLAALTVAGVGLLGALLAYELGAPELAILSARYHSAASPG
jgi:putative ABC transport system permease protein